MKSIRSGLSRIRRRGRIHVWQAAVQHVGFAAPKLIASHRIVGLGNRGPGISTRCATSKASRYGRCRVVPERVAAARQTHDGTGSRPSL